MSQKLGQTWGEELWAKGQLSGQLNNCREVLHKLLRKRFPTVSEAILQRIEVTTDLQRLQACVEQVLDISSPDELRL